MKVWGYFMCIIAGLFKISECKSQKNAEFTYDRLYSEGVSAYDDALWYQCSLYFQDAIKDYNFYKKSVVDCRVNCKHHGIERRNDTNYSELMQSITLRSECIRKCKQKALGKDRAFGRSNELIEKDFQMRKPYEYLQFCYFKLDRMIDAASAAYTFYVLNSDNKNAVKNIQFYREKMKVKDTEFIDLELKPHKEYYIRAMMAYEDELWEEVIEDMEKSLQEFYKEEERCRNECEGPLLATSHLEFYSAVSEHYLNVIKCQYSCEDKLSEVFPEGKDGLLAEHYHYLQFTYYKLYQADRASEAAASFLYIKPQDDVMLRNQKFFVKEGYQDSFYPRPEVVEFVGRQKKLEEEIKFYKKHHTTSDYSESSYDQDGFNDDIDTVYDKYSKSRPTDHYMKRYEDIGLKIIANGNHLNGSKRFATDGFLKEEQCSELKYMIEDYFTNENGSRIISIKDIFEKFGENEEELEVSLRLLLRSSEISRHYMQKYHNLTSLYFKRTVITCWEITQDWQLNRTCLPQEDGSCLENVQDLPKKSEYMSIMILNNLKGADIYFLNKNKTKSRNVSSQCGRLVGMATDDLHNVTIPVSDMRCAVVIIYTTDKKEEEKAYVQTQIALQLFEDEKRLMTEKNNVDIMKELEKNGTTISLTSKDLKDSSAFVADGLAYDEDCVTLQNLVKNNGWLGDGYKSTKPHTKHEIFQGLSLHRTTEKEAINGDGYDYLTSKPSVISPHTEYETFIGLTVLRAASLAYHRQVTPEEVTLFLDLAEKGRFVVEKYFNLTRPLYFDFTHLVCRTAIDGDEDRDDLSHPVHADNCILQPDGTCIKSFPAFTQRDYSAILYLNDEFEGGDFFFAGSDKSEKVSVKPKCGRLVGFDSKEYHGVKAVTKGQRCALALWFTLNPNYKELAHSQARKLISKLSELVPPTEKGEKDTEENDLKKSEEKDSENLEENESDSKNSDSKDESTKESADSDGNSDSMKSDSDLSPDPIDDSLESLKIDSQIEESKSEPNINIAVKVHKKESSKDLENDSQDKLSSIGESGKLDDEL